MPSAPAPPYLFPRRCTAVPRQAASFGMMTATLLLIEAAFVLALRHPRRYGKPTVRCSLADCLTLYRGLVAAVTGGCALSSRRGPVGRPGWTLWVATVLAATVSDWLDGPLARRSASMAQGAALDLEADSWLTLWIAVAAVRWGRLPPVSLAPPCLRYVLPATALTRGTYGEADLGKRWWARVAGVAQMSLLLVALMPRRSVPPYLLRQRLAPAVAAVQLLALIYLFWRIVSRPPSGFSDNASSWGW